jgi:hypothetical protein
MGTALISRRWLIPIHSALCTETASIPPRRQYRLGSSVSCATCDRSLGRSSRPRHVSICRSHDNDGEQEDSEIESSASEGDELIKKLQFDIRAKSTADEHVAESSEKLKALADVAKEEMDRAADLAKMRGDVAFDQALADLNREADMFERKLRRQREEAERQRSETAEWMRDVGASRNQGQFFGNLYEDEEGVSGRAKRWAQMDDVERREAMERRKRILETTEETIRSPARMYIFGLLGGMLMINVAADVIAGIDGLNSGMSNGIAAGGAHVGLDVLYSCLAIGAIYLMVKEKRELDNLK